MNRASATRAMMDREVTMDSWIWIIASLALLGIELGSGTFYVIFFALGALAVGILHAIGLAEPLWLQIFFFTALSAASLVLFRGPLLNRIRGGGAPQDMDDIRQETAIAIDAIEPNASGKAELRGSPWTAHNVGDRALEAGRECVIEKIEGLTLLVRAKY